MKFRIGIFNFCEVQKIGKTFVKFRIGKTLMKFGFGKTFQID